MSYAYSMSMSNTEKDIQVKIPQTIVLECMDYLNGKLVSAELMSQIKNLKEQDPTLSKTEIVEYILDYYERNLRSSLP